MNKTIRGQDRYSLRRGLGISALLLVVGSYIYSLATVSSIDPVTLDLISFSGLDAWVYLGPWYFHFYYATQVAVLTAVILGLPWSGRLFIISVAGFACTSLISGISVARPIEVFVATLIAYIYGALLLLIVQAALFDEKCG